MTDSFKPYSFSVNKEPTGIDYEINRELFRRLDMTTRYKAFPWTRQLARAEKGLDAAILTVYCEDKRPFLDIVSEPFYSVKISLFRKRRPHQDQAPRSLKEIEAGARVGLVRGNYFKDLLTPYSQIMPAFAHKTSLLVHQLHHDRLNYVLEESLPFLYASKELGYAEEMEEVLTVLENRVCTAYSVVYFNGETEALSKRTAAVIKDMKADGFIPQVIDKYIR